MSRDLSALLHDAARAVELPETPPLAETVRRRIEAGPMPVATIRLPRTRPPLLRPILAAAVVAALVLGLTLSLSVTARRAVADLLGVVGIEISFDEEPDVTPRPTSEIPLGTPVTRADAGDRAGFRVLVPQAQDGEPAFYFDPLIGESGMATVVYPRTARTMADVDVLVSQFVASLHENFIKKLAVAGADVRYLSVRGNEAYWIGGGPHLFFYMESDGDVREETVRLAGKVLLWQEGRVTYRIEGAGSLREALALAASLR